jgi:predicted transcriptional regulator
LEKQAPLYKMNKSKYQQLKLKAIELRKKGLSYNEIGKELNVAKSTLSFWLKTIPLTPGQRERLYTKRILNYLARGPSSQRERRKKEVEKIIEKAEKEIQLPISFEAYRLFGAALYWAEGNKTKGCGIANSDPYFIAFMVKWFEKVLGILPSKLKAWLNIYPQQNEQELKQFWSRLTGIPLENFGKSFIKPLSKGYKKNNLYFGTIKIQAPKGTDLRYRIFGWIKAVLKEIDLTLKITQKEWRSLKEAPQPINLPKEIKTPP